MSWRVLTKQQIAEKIKQLKGMGWISSLRPLNAGGIGNTIDNLVGLPETNIPIADSAQWELKTHRIGSASLVTLLHREPLPKGAVTKVLLPRYGWPDAGRPGELSFRQTLNTTRYTDRGFSITIAQTSQTVLVVFEAGKVSSDHAAWLKSVADRGGVGSLNPQPHWDIKDLLLQVSTKMLNTFFVEVSTKREADGEYFMVKRARTLQGFNTHGFIKAVEEGGIYIDFDARTHHNHGTKFRLREDFLPTLFAYVDEIDC